MSERDFVDKMVGRLKGSGGATLSGLLQKEEGETYQTASYARKVGWGSAQSLGHLSFSISMCLTMSFF